MQNADTKSRSAARIQRGSETSSAQSEAAEAFFMPPVQAKLTINQPGDPYEQEADRVADQVVQRLENPSGPAVDTVQRMPITPLQRSAIPSHTPIQAKCTDCEQEEKVQKKEEEEQPIQEKIQRKPIFESGAEPPEEGGSVQRKAEPGWGNVQMKCANCESEEQVQEKEEEEQPIQEKIQRKPIFDSGAEPPDDKGSLQRKAEPVLGNIQMKCAACEQEDKVQREGGDAAPSVPTNFSSRLQSSKGGGSPLPAEVSSSMGEAMGADFSNVRVHTGSEAVGMSNSIQAQAFTHGSDVYFNEGKYDTASSEGQHLLAHELTHTVQQGKSAAQRKQMPPPTKPKTNEKSIQQIGNQNDLQLKLDASKKVILQSEATIFPSSTPPQQKRESIQRDKAKNLPSAKNASQTDFDDTKNKYSGDFPGWFVKKGANSFEIYLDKLVAKKYLTKSDVSWLKLPVKLTKKTKKRKTKQMKIWKDEVREGVGKQMKKLAGDNVSPDQALSLNLVKNSKDSKGKNSSKKSPNVKNSGIIGNFDQLMEESLVPFWSSEGIPNLYDVEHMIDWQIAAEDADKIENLILLERTFNRELGNEVRANIEKHLNAVLKHYRESFKDVPTEATPALMRFNVYVNRFDFKGEDISDSHWYDKEELTSENDADSPYKKDYITVKDAQIPDGHFLLKSSDNRAGAILPYEAEEQLVGGWYITSIYDKASDKLKSLFMQVAVKDENGTLQKGERTMGGKGKDVKNNNNVDFDEDISAHTYKVKGMSRAFGSALKELQVSKLSPIQWEEPDLAGFNVGAMGKVVSTLDVFKNVDISFGLDNGAFVMQADIDLTQFAPNFPKPFKIDSCGVFIEASTKTGLSIGGGVDFSIGTFGQGSLTAKVGKSVMFNGEFNFNNKWFNPAKIGFNYKDGQWGIHGEIGVEEGKIKGVKSAKLMVGYTNGVFSAAGKALLSVPGLNSIDLVAKFDDRGNFQFEAGATLGKIPGVKAGAVTVIISSKEGGDIKLGMHGKVQPDLPNVPQLNAELEVSYNDGVFLLKAAVDYEKGRIKGRIEVGVTNQPPDDTGKPGGDPNTKGDTYIFGFGQLTVDLIKGNKSNATLGVRLTPAGDVLVSGALSLREIRPFGEPKGWDKKLPPQINIQIPLIGVPGLSVYLAISGGPYFKFEWDPLVLKELTVTFPETNIEQLESASLGIKGSVGSRARAEAGLAIEAKLGAQVLVAKLEGFIRGEAGLALEAEVGGDLAADWSFEKGLIMKEINAKFAVTPKAVARLSGGFRVYLDLWLTTVDLYEKKWTFAEGSVDLSGFALNIGFPIRFDEEGNVKPPESPDDMQVEKPDFGGKDGDAILDNIMNGDAKKEREAKKLELRAKIHDDMRKSVNDDEFSPSKYAEKLANKYKEDEEMRQFIMNSVEEEVNIMEHEEFDALKNKLRFAEMPIRSKMISVRVFALFRKRITEMDLMMFQSELENIEHQKQQALMARQQKSSSPTGVKTERVQRKSEGVPPKVSNSFPSQLQSSKGGGSPLPLDVGASMGDAIGADFSKVRVHTNEDAASMSNDINAQAFTHGNDIYFNEGKFNPDDKEGQRLLAHELTHVVQQADKVQRLPDETQTEPISSSHETETVSSQESNSGNTQQPMIGSTQTAIASETEGASETTSTDPNQNNQQNLNDQASNSQTEAKDENPNIEQQSDPIAPTDNQQNDFESAEGQVLQASSPGLDQSASEPTNDTAIEEETIAPNENSQVSSVDFSQPEVGLNSEQPDPTGNSGRHSSPSEVGLNLADNQGGIQQVTPSDTDNQVLNDDINGITTPLTQNPEIQAPASQSQHTQTLLEQVTETANLARQRFTERITQGTEAIAANVQQQQADLIAAGEEQSGAIQAIFANARAQVEAIIGSAQAQLQTDTASHLGALQQGHAATLGQVAASFSEGQERVQTLGGTYADRSLLAAEEAAQQVQTRVQGLAQEAQSIGQEKAQVGGSTPEIARVKANAANEIASDTATNITSGISVAMSDIQATGPETASGFREQGLEAARQVGAGQTEVVNQLTTANQQTTTGVQQIVTQGSQALGNLGAQLKTQLTSLEQTLQDQLQTQIAHKSQEIYQVGQHAITTFQQQGQLAITSGDEQLDEFNLQLADMDIHPNEVAEVSGEIVSRVNSAYNDLLTTTNGAFQQVDTALTQAGAAIVTAINGIAANASSQVQTFLGGAQTQVTQQVSTISGQIGTTVTQTNAAGSGMVSQVTMSLEGQLGQVDNAFGQGLERYQGTLVEQVTSVEGQAREPMQSLSGRIDQGQQRVKQRAQRSWIENQWNDLVEMLSWELLAGLVAGLLVGVFIIATFGTGAAVLVIAGAVAGAVGALASTVVGNARAGRDLGENVLQNMIWGAFGGALGAAVLIFLGGSFIAGGAIGGLAAGLGLGTGGTIALLVGGASVTAGILTVVDNWRRGEEDLTRGIVGGVLLAGLLTLLGIRASRRSGGTRTRIRQTVGQRLSIAQRLRIYFERLGNAPSARNAEEGLNQVRDILNQVEDEFSGVVRQDPPPAPNQTDGRMYPPLDDYVTRNPDGSITARTRGHTLEIGSDGSIRITNRATGNVDLDKPGAN